MTQRQEIRWLLKEKYNGKLTPSAWKDIHRLKHGEHISYLIGFVEFLGCKIDLAFRPLIPRPETEFWVERTFVILGSGATPESEVKRGSGVDSGCGSSLTRMTEIAKLVPIRVLDIFSGSGCIGISILKHYPNASVDFVDVDENCLKQAKLNCKINGLDMSKCQFVQSDIFSSLGQNKYNYIFANPPYLSKNSKHIQKSVLQNEPHLSLFGGGDGLDIIKRFLQEAKNRLLPNGKIFMEFDSPQKRNIQNILKDLSYEKTTFNKDQFGKWRWVEILA